MRAQQQLWGEVKGVPALSRRVADREVESLEVVPLGLHLGPKLDLVAEALEHGLDLPAYLGENVYVPPAEWRSREGDVDGLGLGDVCQPRALDLCSPRRQSRFDGLLRLVRGLAQQCPLRRFELSDAG